MMKSYVICIGIFLITLAGGCNTTDPGKPNVILIMADDMGWGDMSCRDNPVQLTPALDKMAGEGIMFDRFYSAAAVCGPTRASVMTGSTPYRVGMMNCCSGHIRSHFELLPEYFKQEGYATGHFGKWHLGSLSKDSVDFPEQGRDPLRDYSPPWDNGFDVCFSTHNVVPTWDPMEVPDQGGNWFCQRRSDDGWWGQHYFDHTGKMFSPEDPLLKGDDSRIIMDRVLPFIETQASGVQPFFATVWFHAPHTPTVAGGEFLEMYAGHEGRHHYGAISAMDAQIGRLRDYLVELGIAENTLIWFCSDNGAAKYNPNFGDYGGFGSNGPFRGWKTQLWEGGIRVPGILVYPGHFKQDVISAPASTSDIYPTLVDLIWNTEPLQPEDGQSLMPLINGKEEQRGSYIGFRTGSKHMVMMDDRYKLHRFQDKDGTRWELYDLVEDRSETNDVAGAFPDEMNRLKRQLNDWDSGCEEDLLGLTNK
jgi:arylsulfatase A-like enzyme